MIICEILYIVEFTECDICSYIFGKTRLTCVSECDIKSDLS